MTRVARLTWQAADPAALALLLRERLGVEAAPPAAEPGAWRIDLGSDVMELVPWRREQARDNPSKEGRLMFEPLWGAGSGTGDSGEPDPAAPTSFMELVGVGWATVDLDRAEAELEPYLEPYLEPAGSGHGTRAGDDTRPGDAARTEPHLGARVRVRGTDSLPGGAIVLMEPVTEGRLAASLARDGEGPCALYLRPGPGALSAAPGLRRRVGPLGSSVLLHGAVRAGPHLLLLVPASPRVRGRSAAGTAASSTSVAPGTISP